jgi:hypothetical protein
MPDPIIPDPDADTALTVDEAATLMKLQARDKKGQFTRAAAVPPTPPPVTPPVTPPTTPTVPSTADPIVLRYAEALKTQLGAKYVPKLDTMEVRERVEMMELLLESHNTAPTTAPPLIKGGEGGSIGVPPPEVDTKPKTFLQKQQEDGFSSRLQGQGTYAALAAKLFRNS